MQTFREPLKCIGTQFIHNCDLLKTELCDVPFNRSYTNKLGSVEVKKFKLFHKSYHLVELSVVQEGERRFVPMYYELNGSKMQFWSRYQNLKSPPTFELNLLHTYFPFVGREPEDDPLTFRLRGFNSSDYEQTGNLDFRCLVIRTRTAFDYFFALQCTVYAQLILRQWQQLVTRNDNMDHIDSNDNCWRQLYNGEPLKLAFYLFDH